MRKFFAVVSMFILLVNLCSAATIHGTIYDFSLNKAENAIVKVNSSPKQKYLSDDGKYSFNLEPGDYLITATYKTDNTLMTAQENVTIRSDGEYILDIFLFPDLSEENELIKDVGFDIDTPYNNEINIFVIIFLVIILMLATVAFTVFILKSSQKKEIDIEDNLLDNNLKEIIGLLKKNQRRMTQKEIRKEINYSEAKVSLMITELESIGYVKKIKKGRGNIIILTKK
ncbi:winged helix-turn-helix transcriptional regulator [Candidatus Woesearchaeota archaeon]|nr:winged helix-turn-helix transcriptional regulator [Candidatus Woesearchaeota archaeon]